MNKGLSVASGEWIYFLGADDTLYSPETVFRLHAALERTGLDVVYGNVIFRKGANACIDDGRFDWRKLHRHNLCQQYIFYRRRVFERVGRFELRYRWLADYALNLRVFGDPGLRKLYVNELIAVFDGEGASAQHLDIAFLADRERLYREAFGRARRLTARSLDRLRDARERLIRALTSGWPGRRSRGRSRPRARPIHPPRGR